MLQVLGMDLMRSGFLSVLPWLTMAISANVAGWAADTMVAKGMSITKVRKIMQTVSPRPVPSAPDACPQGSLASPKSA